MAKSNFSLKILYEVCSGNLMPFMHVLASGNIGIEEKSSSPLGRNSTEGVGENPIGGTTDAPVANVKIVCSFDGPPSSNKCQMT